MSRDYLDWRSQLKPEQVFGEVESLAYPVPWRDGYIYLTSIPEEGNRSSLIYRSASEPAEPKNLVSEPYDLRTRICEYGGKPFWLFGDLLIFANDKDQSLYKFDLQNLDSPPVQLTPTATAECSWRYADIVQIAPTAFLAVVEEHRAGYQEPASWLGYISGGDEPAMPQRLSPEADFFSNLVIDTKRKKLAWVAWNHPGMPWDETELWVASYELQEASSIFELGTPTQVTMADAASICQLLMLDCGDLLCVADFSQQTYDHCDQYWNIWRVDLSGSSTKANRITSLEMEFGYPHWQYGDHRLVEHAPGQVVAIASAAAKDILFLIDVDTEIVAPLNGDGIYFENLCTNGRGKTMGVVRFADQMPAIFELESSNKLPVVRRQARLHVDHADISHPRHITINPTKGTESHAFYYPPVNQRFSQDTAGLPPLLVMVHGGPTARAYGYFDLQKQFWTQNGFAVVDVNHRGSSGYGRPFRDALYGGWGEIDSADIAAVIEHLIEVGLADPERVCIRGKSAGGYAVLCALTQFPDLFSAGACYYGIGNLATLATHTHKFEKYYSDRLVGERFDKTRIDDHSSRYYQRSPINMFSAVTAAMIIFQGSEDKVVPPSVAHEMVEALKVQKLPHKYVEYAAEGHGFRDVANNIDAWQQELAFYRSHLSRVSA